MAQESLKKWLSTGGSGYALSVVFAITSLSDFSNWIRSNALEVVMYVTGAILLSRLAVWSTDKWAERVDRKNGATSNLAKSEAAKHRHAVIDVLKWVFLVLDYSIAAILVVQQLGVPLTSLVAPATVAGVALGFGAQRIVQDILAGFFIVSERQYGFGDVVRMSTLGATTGVTGTVEEVTLRITRLRTVSGEVVIIPNGQLVQVTNLSRDWARAVVDVPVPVTTDVTQVTDVLRCVGEETYADEELHPLMLDPPSVMGIESIDVDQVSVRMVARTLPGRQFEVSRALRSKVTMALRQAGITMSKPVETDHAGASS